MRSNPKSYVPGQAAPAIPAYADRPGSSREAFLVAVFTLFSSLSYFLIQYDRLRIEDPGLEAWMRGILAGVVPAPIQYRIALAYCAHFLELHAHLRVNQSLPILDAVSYALAVALLYILFRSSPGVESARPSQRFLLLGLFLAAVQFPVLWIFPWGRPETLPTTVYLAAITLLAVRRSRLPFALVCLLTLLLALVQALVRADVPFLAGIAIAVAAALAIPFPRPRLHIAALGLLCAATGGATQLYLQCIAYPAAKYPASTPKIQLLTNLNPFYAPMHIPIFLTALAPLLVSVLLLRRCRLRLEPADKLVLLMCALYLPAWITTGLMVEVRIFVPFLFLASPTIARIWAAFLWNHDHGAQPQPTVSLP